MSIKNYEPGDINIIGIKLGKIDRQIEVDLTPQLIAMSIYEDLSEPSMLLEITLIDSINLVQDFPIVGEEVLTVTYNTPGRDASTKLGFLVYSVENTAASPNSKASTYTLKAVTPLHFFNAGAKITKSYKDTVSEIVKDIVKICAGESSIKIIKLNVEKTKGLIPITVPSLNPFEAIDFLRQKAVSAEYPSGGSFVFFENQFGCQFRSIEGLLAEGKKNIASKTFTFSPDTKSDSLRQQYAFRNILNFEHVGKFNSVEKINSGIVSSIVESFDVLSKGLDVTEFKLAEKAKTFTTTESKSKLPNSPAFLEKYNSRVSKNFFMSKDSSKGVDFVDDFAGSKHSYLQLLGQNSTRVLINGDNYMAAGDLVELNLPEVSGTTEVKTKDRLNSGNYLVTRLRHVITSGQGGKPKHQIAMDCVRMGYK